MAKVESRKGLLPTAAVVGGDVQAGIAFVDGAEQAPKVLPEGLRIVRIAVLEGALEGFGGQQAAVFAKGAKQRSRNQGQRKTSTANRRE